MERTPLLARSARAAAVAASRAQATARHQRLTAQRSRVGNPGRSHTGRVDDDSSDTASDTASDDSLLLSPATQTTPLGCKALSAKLLRSNKGVIIMLMAVLVIFLIVVSACNTHVPCSCVAHLMCGTPHTPFWAFTLLAPRA